MNCARMCQLVFLDIKIHLYSICTCICISDNIPFPPLIVNHITDAVTSILSPSEKTQNAEENPLPPQVNRNLYKMKPCNNVFTQDFCK